MSVTCRWERVRAGDICVLSLPVCLCWERSSISLHSLFYIHLTFTNRWFSNGTIFFSVNRVIERLILICTHSFKAYLLPSWAVFLSYCLRWKPGAWVLFSAGQLTAPQRAKGQRQGGRSGTSSCFKSQLTEAWKCSSPMSVPNGLLLQLSSFSAIE